MNSDFNPGTLRSQFESAINQAIASQNGTAQVLDPNGIPIHKDIIASNRYGPSIPFTSLLQTLQGSGTSSGMCLLNKNLTSNIFIGGLSNDQLQFSPNVVSKLSTESCSPVIDKGIFKITDGQTNIRLNLQTATRIRILLQELSLLNQQANLFYDERGKKAVEMLSDSPSDPAGVSSYRMTYMTRRETASSSNYGAWVAIAVIVVVWAFTASYAYFSGGGEVGMAMLSIVPASVIVLMMLGYVFIDGYGMMISPGG
jgi:hypothetical protein